MIPLADMDVDNIRIAFEEGSLTTLKIVIGAILLGVALETRPSDFLAAAKRPGSIAIGVVAQFLVLPALTFVLTLLLDVRGSVALGMILVACCPPGNVSNILTHRARGDVALSVSMTAVGNVLAIVAMPLNVAFWGSLHPTGKELLEGADLVAPPGRVVLRMSRSTLGRNPVSARLEARWGHEHAQAARFS